MKDAAILQKMDWQMLLRGAHRQKSAIWALVFKEFKIKLGKSRIGLFWVMIEPIVSMLMISGIWYATGRTEIHGVPVTLFIGSGFIVYMTVRQGINYIPHAVIANQALLNYPQVKPIDTIWARFVVGMWLHAWAAILMILGLWWLLGHVPSFPDPLLCAKVIAIAMIMAMGLGLPIGIFGTLNEGFLKIVALISMPLTILSGVMYSMSELPPTAKEFLSYNPIVHLVAGFRSGAFGVKPFSHYDLDYPLYFAIGTFALGYGLYFLFRFRLLQK